MIRQHTHIEQVFLWVRDCSELRVMLTRDVENVCARRSECENNLSAICRKVARLFQRREGSGKELFDSNMLLHELHYSS